MAGGRSGEDKSQTKRKLVETKTCFMFPRWVLFHVVWVLMATIKGKKKSYYFKEKKKQKKNEENRKRKHIKEKEVFFQNLVVIDQRER